MGQLTAQDELTIFQNILAQSPQGLSDPNLIGKFAQAKAKLHIMNSMGQIQQQQAQMQPQANSMQNQGQTAPMTGQPTPSTTQGDLGANSIGNPNQNQSNQSPMQQEGQGSLNLPQ